MLLAMPQTMPMELSQTGFLKLDQTRVLHFYDEAWQLSTHILCTNTQTAARGYAKTHNAFKTALSGTPYFFPYA